MRTLVNSSRRILNDLVQGEIMPVTYGFVVSVDNNGCHYLRLSARCSLLEKLASTKSISAVEPKHRKN